MVFTNTHYITTESIHYESVMFYCTNTIRGSIVVNMSKEPRQVQLMWHFCNDCSAIYENEIRLKLQAALWGLICTCLYYNHWHWAPFCKCSLAPGLSLTYMSVNYRAVISKNDTKLHLPWFLGCDGNIIKIVLFSITLSKDLRQVQLCDIFADDCSVIYANVNETKTRGQGAL